MGGTASRSITLSSLRLRIFPARNPSSSAWNGHLKQWLALCGATLHYPEDSILQDLQVKLDFYWTCPGTSEEALTIATTVQHLLPLCTVRSACSVMHHFDPVIQSQLQLYGSHGRP